MFDPVLFKLPEEIKSLLSFCNDVISVSCPLQVIANVCSKEFKGVSDGDWIAIYLYGCFGKWPKSKVNNEFLGFGCVELEVIVRTPIYSLVHHHAVLCFIIV